MTPPDRTDQTEETVERPAAGGRGISFKLIATNTLQVVLIIALISGVVLWRSRATIDEVVGRLETDLTAALRQTGQEQLQLLTQSARVLLVMSDFTALQAIVRDLARQERITAVAVVDSRGVVVAHGDPALVGSPGKAVIGAPPSGEAPLHRVARVGGRRSMVFSGRVIHGRHELGAVMLAYSLQPLEAGLARAQALEQRAIAASATYIVALGLLAIVLGVAMAVYQGVRISRPIHALARQARQIAEGDLGARAAVSSTDEIGVLASQFNHMARRVAGLLEEVKIGAVAEKELEVASAVQSTIVPSGDLVTHEGITLAGYFKPATTCGGDWWHHHATEEGKVLVLIGDATGHGVGAAMITAVAKGAATTYVDSAAVALSPEGALTALNAAVHEAAKGSFYMTCLAVLFDPRERTLQVANAGHHFPYIAASDGARLRAVVARGKRLGRPETQSFKVATREVAPGDMLVLYTDGVTECENDAGEQYGERRFRAVIEAARADPPDAARDAIIGEVDAFRADRPLQDDITLVVGKFGG